MPRPRKRATRIRNPSLDGSTGLKTDLVLIINQTVRLSWSVASRRWAAMSLVSECACPRAQQSDMDEGAWLIPGYSCVWTLLRPRTIAVHEQGGKARSGRGGCGVRVRRSAPVPGRSKVVRRKALG